VVVDAHVFAVALCNIISVQKSGTHKNILVLGLIKSLGGNRDYMSPRKLRKIKYNSVGKK